MTEYLYQEDLYRFPEPVLVVLARPWHKILDDEKALLTKILGSVRLTIEQVVIQFHPEISVESVKAQNPARVLIFGSKLSGDFQPYQKMDIQTTAVIWADDLSVLDDSKKKSLWLALRQMFGV